VLKSGYIERIAITGDIPLRLPSFVKPYELLPQLPEKRMILHCAAYQHGHCLGDISLEDIGEVLGQEGSFVWVGLYEPSQDLLKKIQQKFDLHELAVEDAHLAHQRPKIEEYGDSLLVVLYTMAFVEDKIRFGETHVFLGRRFLVSVWHSATVDYAKIRQYCDNLPQQLTLGPGLALYVIMDLIVDHYQPVVHSLEERVEHLENRLFQNPFDRKSLEQMHELRREVLALRNATAPLLDVCTVLMRLHTDIIPQDIRVYFRDIADHVNHVVRAAESLREMLLAAMQVNLSLVTVHQNEIVKRLAGWGAIVCVPTMVFSLYGMNFRDMPELEWNYGYPLTLVGVGVACIWLYRRLKKDGWL
jgi:magnesium transporter